MHGGIGDRLDSPHPALGLVIEHHLLALDAHVALEHRGQPVAVVALRVLLRADTGEANVKQSRGAGQGAGQ